MPMWELLKNFYPILTLLVPGLVLLFMRSLFMTRRDLSARTKLLPHFAVSVVYYAFLFPAIDLIAFTASIQKNACVLELSLWFFLIFVVPAGLGLFLGVDAQKGWTRSLLQRCGLHPAHPMPAAWDWKFSQPDECYVLATLKNGKRFAGTYCSDSFTSSDPSERDIYIQPLFNCYDSSTLFPHEDKGILIVREEIQTIEFWHHSQEEIPMTEDIKTMLLEGHNPPAGGKLTQKLGREGAEKGNKPSGEPPAKQPTETSNQDNSDKK